MQVEYKIIYIREVFSNIAFLCLFPCFFIYHSAVGLGIIGPIFGGWFGVWALIFLPGLLFFYLYIDVNLKKFPVLDLLFFSIICITLFIAVINYAEGLPKDNQKYMLKWTLTGILYNVVCYLIAKSITLSSSSYFFKALIFLHFAMIFIVLMNIDNTTRIFALGTLNDDENVTSYQGFARCLAVSGMIILSLLKPGRKRYFLFLATLIGLFFNGARTEFVLFSISGLYLCLNTKNLNKLTFLFGSIALACILIFKEIFVTMMPNNRMAEILNGFSESTSFSARKELTLNAIDVISNNTLLGNYGYYLEQKGPGMYAHNLLSSWAELGALAFFLYFAIFILSALGFLKNAQIHIKEKELAIAFFLFVSLAFITSKEYSYMLFGMMVGFYSRFICSFSSYNRYFQFKRHY